MGLPAQSEPRPVVAAPVDGGEPFEQIAAAARAHRRQVFELFNHFRNRMRPERNKVLQRIVEYLDALERYAALRHASPDLPGNDRARAEAPNIVGWLAIPFEGCPTLDGAWSYADALKSTLVLYGDDDYVATKLHDEVRRKGRVQWKSYLPEEELDALAEAYNAGTVTDAQRVRAVTELRHIYALRSDEGADIRARDEMRGRALALSFALLVPVVVLAGFSVVKVADEPASRSVDLWTVLLCASFGALGAILSGAFTARDLKTITQFTLAWGWSAVRPVVGAGAGLLALAVLHSDIIRRPGTAGAATSWGALAAYSFAIGFSEPLLLDVVGRLAKSANDKEPAKS